MNSNSENVCPCCGRHCSAENLHCQRGMAHFGIKAAGEQEDHEKHEKFHNHHFHGKENIWHDRGR